MVIIARSFECTNELQIVTSTAVILNVDLPLNTRNSSKLEMEHSAFVLTLAHQASSIVSLRMLDSGMAKDVTGVIRASYESIRVEVDTKNKEFLYVVKDNLISVFNRGNNVCL